MDLDTLRRFFQLSPFMRDLGAEPTAVSPGRVTAVLPMQDRFRQHSGHAHAGVQTTLADHSMGSAAQTLVADGHWVLTADLKVSLLRPADGERLVCEAWVVKPGRTLSFTEAEVWAEREGDRTLVLKASATMAVVPLDRR
ncbi:PaaI family thioesterase [Ideonella sp. 4Y11]|uniref:Medium/long-chain acyl-CoA thioesterase YigI n=1 Tax=Ideonella aquatica TaxID=2824119 RepID=A0A940YMJ8_9BURK|nr:PaaI family thioesterase [Ideonella aquatica]MBQ0959677.1 PaaI family thioesterase [Ideonella aquatica]